MNNPEFEKVTIPTFCENCKKESFVFLEDTIAPAFVVCGNCGNEFSDVWCSKCGMGGPFVENIRTRPISWKCPRCKTEYHLPEGFYETPIRSYLEDALPSDVLLRARPPMPRKERIKWILVFTLLGTGLMTMVVLVASSVIPWLAVVVAGGIMLTGLLVSRIM